MMTVEIEGRWTCLQGDFGDYAVPVELQAGVATWDGGKTSAYALSGQTLTIDSPNSNGTYVLEPAPGAGWSGVLKHPPMRLGDQPFTEIVSLQRVDD